jgi:hypothetical protein
MELKNLLIEVHKNYVTILHVGTGVQGEGFTKDEALRNLVALLRSLGHLDAERSAPVS